MIRVANKKTIQALTLRQIKAGKSRSIFATIAIILTSVLVTAVVAMGVGLMDANKQMMMKMGGDSSEISLQYLTADEMGIAVSHPLIKKCGISRYVAKAGEDSLKNVPLEVCTMDANFAEFSYSIPTTGRLPEYENEVAVKAWMLDELGLPREIWQMFPLSFTVGNTRYDMKLTVCGFWEDDFHLHPWGTAVISDELADKVLVGIAPRVTRITGEYSGVIQLSANLNGRQSDLQANLERLISETELDPELTAPFVHYAYESSVLDVRAVVAITLILLIVITSGYLLIYNIFYISVIKDIKYYGLLKTIGTTKTTNTTHSELPCAYLLPNRYPSRLNFRLFFRELSVPAITCNDYGIRGWCVDKAKFVNIHCCRFIVIGNSFYQL